MNEHSSTPQLPFFVQFCLVIILVIVVFLLTIFLPRPSCFFDVDTVLPEAKGYISEIRAWCEKNVTKEKKTEVIRVDNEETQITKENKQLANFPFKIPNCSKRILFIDPNSKTSKHIVNEKCKYVLIFPIKIPIGGRCKIWVDGQTKVFNEESILVIDAKRERYFINNHYAEDMILATVGLVADA